MKRFDAYLCLLLMALVDFLDPFWFYVLAGLLAMGELLQLKLCIPFKNSNKRDPFGNLTNP